MDLTWLSAPDREVAAGIAEAGRGDRPKWVPTRRQLLLHVNNCLMLWYLAIASLTLGVRIDTVQNSEILPRDIRDIAVLFIILVAWIIATRWLERWAERPRKRAARIRQWRASLTALANGFEPTPTAWARFPSLVTVGAKRFYPRYEAFRVEFGNLRQSKPHAGSWRYLRVQLPEQLPHLILDSTATSAVARHLPVDIAGQQRLSLEGDFDDYFRLYVPSAYETDALFLLTPDVMAALTDYARDYSIEFIDDSVVFFAPGGADFATPQAWESVDAILKRVVPPLRSNARRYRDERVPGQRESRTVGAIHATYAAYANADSAPAMPEPRIGVGGQRLMLRDRRTGVWQILGVAGWLGALAFLYVLPGVLAFAGILSIIDGH